MVYRSKNTAHYLATACLSFASAHASASTAAQPGSVVCYFQDKLSVSRDFYISKATPSSNPAATATRFSVFLYKLYGVQAGERAVCTYARAGGQADSSAQSAERYRDVLINRSGDEAMLVMWPTTPLPESYPAVATVGVKSAAVLAKQ